MSALINEFASALQIERGERAAAATGDDDDDAGPRETEKKESLWVGEALEELISTQVYIRVVFSSLQLIYIYIYSSN